MWRLHTCESWKANISLLGTLQYTFFLLDDLDFAELLDE